MITGNLTEVFNGVTVITKQELDCAASQLCEKIRLEMGRHLLTNNAIKGVLVEIISTSITGGYFLEEVMNCFNTTGELINKCVSMRSVEMKAATITVWTTN